MYSWVRPIFVIHSFHLAVSSHLIIVNFLLSSNSGNGPIGQKYLKKISIPISKGPGGSMS